MAVVATCPVRLPGLAAAVAVVAVTVLLVNGVNLLDGLDMLAGGVVAVGAAAFAAILHGTGHQVAIAIAAAILGFLVFNRPPARIYLGDGGSYLLGTVLAVLLAESFRPHLVPAVGVAALAIVALAAAEVAFAIVRRLRGRRALMAGDRGHPYDRLVSRGWSPLAASAAYVGVEAVLGAGAVAAARHGAMGPAVALDVAAAAGLLAGAALSGALTPDREASA